jgi:hypothetical protein
MSLITKVRRWIGGCPDPILPEPVPSRPGIEYCYFGIQNGDAAQIAGSVTMAHVGSWGDWNSPAFMHQMNADFIEQALEAGIERIMVTLDWCLFTQTNPRHPLPNGQCTNNLISFFDFLKSIDRLKYVQAYYLIDEPDIEQNQLNNEQVINAAARVRDVLNAYVPAMPKGPICVIYGPNNNYPGITAVDWAGFDNYGAPIFQPGGQYDGLKAQLRADQKTIIVPGGNDPWREDPRPFYQKAQQDTKVAMIMPFKWFGTDGIGVNGMGPAYVNVGQQVVAAWEV